MADAEPADEEKPPDTPRTPEPPTAVTNDALPPAGTNGAEAQGQPPQATRPSRET